MTPDAPAAALDGPLDASAAVEDARPWASWSRAELSSLPLPEDTRAFAYWQLAGAGEPFWVELFACLDTARAKTTPNLRASVNTLLTTLEPEAGVTRTDLTFVTGATPTPWEGVVLRTWTMLETEATPMLAVAMLRRVEERRPTRIVFWGQPGFAQAPEFTATLALGADDVRGDVREGLTPLFEDQEAGSWDAAGELMFNMMQRALWSKVTDQAFLEPALARTNELAPTPAGLPHALGLEVRVRDLTEMLSESVFIPDIADDIEESLDLGPTQ